VLAHVPAERIMIGSDLPENISTEIGKILTLAVSDEQKRSILCTTGCRVFGS
jgi:predicted TIM-barrel fold metal-dependent hydrolase